MTFHCSPSTQESPLVGNGKDARDETKNKSVSDVDENIDGHTDNVCFFILMGILTL